MEWFTGDTVHMKPKEWDKLPPEGVNGMSAMNMNQNMHPNRFALHETLEVHELLAAKNVHTTKATAMKGMVTDQRLGALLQSAIDADKRHIQDLQGLLSRARASVLQ